MVLLSTCVVFKFGSIVVLKYKRQPDHGGRYVQLTRIAVITRREKQKLIKKKIKNLILKHQFNLILVSSCIFLSIFVIFLSINIEY